MILSKAARTAAAGPAAGVVLREDVLGEGEAVASGDLATVLGVGEGFGATVRPRLDGEVVLLFCATAAAALKMTTQVIIAILFILSTPSSNCHGGTEPQS